MTEINDRVSDWKQQVESSSFITNRKGDVDTSGSQFTVYTRPGIDVVIKTPKNPEFLKGYETARNIAPDLILPHEVVHDLTLKIDHRQTKFQTAIVQKKVAPAHLPFLNALETRDADALEKLILAGAATDRNFFERGLFIPDPYFSNMGIDTEGSLKFFDLGSVRSPIPDRIHYANLAMCRAKAHYSLYFTLQNKAAFMRSSSGQKFHDLYAEAIGFDARIFPNIKTMSDLDMHKTFNPTTALLLASVGDDEFRRFAPGGASFDLYTDFLQNLPKSLYWES